MHLHVLVRIRTALQIMLDNKRRRINPILVNSRARTSCASGAQGMHNPGRGVGVSPTHENLKVICRSVGRILLDVFLDVFH